MLAASTGIGGRHEARQLSAPGGRELRRRVDGGVVDAARRLASRHAGLRAVLAAGALGELRSATAGQRPDVALEAIEFLPPIRDPEKLLCVGLNYKTHVIATGTPGGVGSRRTPPVWMRKGDEIAVEISSIGVLRNPIVEE